VRRGDQSAMKQRPARPGGIAGSGSQPDLGYARCDHRPRPRRPLDRRTGRADRPPSRRRAVRCRPPTVAARRGQSLDEPILAYRRRTPTRVLLATHREHVADRPTRSPAPRWRPKRADFTGSEGSPRLASPVMPGTVPAAPGFALGERSCSWPARPPPKRPDPLHSFTHSEPGTRRSNADAGIPTIDVGRRRPPSTPRVAPTALQGLDSGQPPWYIPRRLYNH
jgi:hypothetical protein